MKFPARVLLTMWGADAFRTRSARHKGGQESSGSLLVPVSVEQPDPILFPPRYRAPLEPANTEIEGAKHSNKFWGNWVVNDGNVGMSIYPSPYTLRFKQVGDSPSGALIVMKGETDYQGTFFTSHWLPDFNFGAVEQFAGMHTVVKEQHFGIHVQVRPKQGFNCTTTYPVYAGMAYPSARYEGGCTPHITADMGLKMVKKVRPGVFRFQKYYHTLKEYRVYVLDKNGQFVDDSYTFNSQGVLNKKLDGWVRFADLQQPSDAAYLDQYAQRVLVGWDFEVEEGVLRYNFETTGSGPFLNWAYANHMAFLDSGAEEVTGLTRTRSPVKGKMFALAGSTQWTFKFSLTEALAIDFLPAEEPRPEHVNTLQAEIERDFVFYKSKWRLSMHKRDHYFSGKGFQKIGTICHMMAKFKGKSHPDVQACADILLQGFKCMYDRSVSDGSDRRLAGPNGDWSQEDGCWWSPFGTWYDLSWGGIPSRWDDSPTCGLDFGNSCYNDHHYHWGYYVVSAAMLVDLVPSMKYDSKFVDFINMFIRDVANPSVDDTYFPQFRSFDFFDMHSWSRGLKPDPSGKDQESTSEEINFHFGVLLWGRMIGNDKMSKLGATTLVLSSRALQEYFLMKRDNPNHPRSFSINHVTGIFFQNKVHLTTWFGQDPRYIHGIQMLPLSAGLILSRKDDFAYEEWKDQLEGIPINIRDPWWSILLSGNVAMHNPDMAWSYLVQMKPEDYDDGLTKSWALYWTSVQKADGPRPTPAPAPTPPPPPPPGPGPAPGPPSGIFCNPNTNPPQFCPGGIQCPQCGAGACECPR